ncbi:hypothetical protein [Nocardioides montaniterrae]
MTERTTRPQAVQVASWLTWVLVFGGLVVSVFVVLDRHDIADSWAPLHPDDSNIRPISFVPVVVVLYAVIAITALILLSMLRQGQAVARYSMTVLDLGLVLGALAMMRTAPPTSVVWALIFAALLSSATLVFLWHPTTSRFLRASSWRRAEVSPSARS